MTELRVPIEHLWICNKLSASQVQSNPQRTKSGMDWLRELMKDSESQAIRYWASGKHGSIKSLMQKKVAKSHLKPKKLKRQRSNLKKSELPIDFVDEFISERLPLLREKSTESAVFISRVQKNANDRGWITEKQAAAVDKTFKRYSIE